MIPTKLVTASLFQSQPFKNLTLQSQMQQSIYPTPTQQHIQHLFTAIKSGNTQAIKTILDQFKQQISNQLEPQLRQPPLYFATTNSDENLSCQMVRLLVQAGANPKFKDANEQTIIFYACRDGKINLVEYLLENGCSLIEQDLYGQTPLFYVANENQVQLLKFFTPQMAKHCDKLAKQTPLFYSARRGHLQMCKQLVALGCNLNHHDLKGKTPLYYARKSKFADVAAYLTTQFNKIGLKSQLQESEHNQSQKQKKKRDTIQNSTNKNAYRITIYQDGELHDLNSDEVKDLLKSQPQVLSLLNNPEGITQQMIENIVEDTWEKQAQKILAQCWKLKTSHWFYEPVEPLKFGVNDYFEVIAHPMDLGTIKKKLACNVYENPKQFATEMMLVWNNCYKYNGESHEVSGYAHEIQKTFNEACQATGFNKHLSQ